MQGAGVADMEFALEAFTDHIINPYFQCLNADLINYFSRKCIQEQQSGIGFTDTTLPKVEHGFLIQLANGGPMGALHIIGIDLEERLGMRLCRICHQNIFTILESIGLLGIFPHKDMPVKDSTGFLIKNAFEELIAVTIRFCMIDKNLVIDMLRLIHEIYPVYFC